MKYCIMLPESDVFAFWREAARRAISHRIAPHDICWNEQTQLFGGDPLPASDGTHKTLVSKNFIKLASSVIWHSAPERFGLLYEALWRIDHDDGAPLSQNDPLGRKLGLMAKSVGRDIHRMHAFVRFRELPTQDGRRSFAAWFEPEHLTLEPAIDFFVKRFADMDWMIATPYLTAYFSDGLLSFEKGKEKPELPEDASETLWATYFANIFNPARVKLNAMRAEMPKKYWHNLPETRLIPSMLADAEARVERMRAAGASQPRQGATAISTRYRATIPVAVNMPETLAEAGESAMQCQRCSLCETATQTVWGTGNPNAQMMIVGEQPGDREDLAGQPFVGPAGQLLSAAMDEAGISLQHAWLTNAVKHFKFKSQGNIRLHQNPDRYEILQCRWWLGLELAFIQPKMVLALGKTAAFALTNDDHPISERRGILETGLHGGPVLISWHPAHILRIANPSIQDRLRSELIADLAALRVEITNDLFPSSIQPSE